MRHCRSQYSSAVQLQVPVTPPAHLQETRATVTGILACASGWCDLQHECVTCYPKSQEVEARRKADRGARNGLEFGPGRAWDGCGPRELEFSPAGPRDFGSQSVALSSFPLSISALRYSDPASRRTGVMTASKMRLFQGQMSHFVPFFPSTFAYLELAKTPRAMHRRPRALPWKPKAVPLGCVVLAFQAGRRSVRREMASSLGRAWIKTGGGGLHPPYARTPVSPGLIPPAPVGWDLHYCTNAGKLLKRAIMRHNAPRFEVGGGCSRARRKPLWHRRIRVLWAGVLAARIHRGARRTNARRSATGFVHY